MEGTSVPQADPVAGSSTRIARAEQRSVDRRRRLRAALAAVLFGGLAAATARYAYATMFLGFHPYDDEGFHLLTLRTFLSGHTLYDDVFAQYGPFYYQAMAAVFRLLGAVPTHDTGRLVTISLWVSGSLLLGFTLFRLTGSLLIGLVVEAGVFVVLYTLINEPMHPGGLLVFLLIAIVAVSVLVVPRRGSLGMFLMGALAMATAFVKVNVGLFALLSVALAACAVFPALASKTALRLAVSAAFVFSPFALMLKDLDQPWARRYAVFVAMAALSVVATATRLKPSQRLRTRQLGWLAGGLGSVAIVVPVLTIVQGTSPSGFLRGFLLDPLRQPDIFTIPLHLPLWPMLLGVVALAAAMIVARWRPEGGILPGLVGLAGGMGMLLGLLGPSPFGPFSIGLALPLVWLAVRTSIRDGEEMANLLIPSLAVLQALHAYPVAGSQLAWSIFLLVPAGAIAVREGQRQLARVLLRRSQGVPAVAAIVWIPLVAFTVWFTRSAYPWLESHVSLYRQNAPLNLPGAYRLRLVPEQVGSIRNVTAGLKENCSTFVSLPGMNSFYLFTEQEPPTTINQSGWMYVFDEEVQSDIVRKIESVEGLCVLRNEPLVDFWRQGRPLPNRPLVVYIKRSFQHRFRWGDFVLLVRATP